MENKKPALSRSLLRLSKQNRQICAAVVAGLSLLVCGSPVRAETAYVVVQPSTAAPQGTTASFLAFTTSYFNATVQSNPFFPGTYNVLLVSPLGGVPAPAVNFTSTGTYIVKVGDEIKTVYQSTEPINEVYAYGWSDGVDRQNLDMLGTVADIYSVNCSSPTYWGMVDVDSTTCAAVLGKIYDDVSDIYFSTHTVPAPFGQGN